MIDSDLFSSSAFSFLFFLLFIQTLLRRIDFHLGVEYGECKMQSNDLSMNKKHNEK